MEKQENTHPTQRLWPILGLPALPFWLCSPTVFTCTAFWHFLHFCSGVGSKSASGSQSSTSQRKKLQLEPPVLAQVQKDRPRFGSFLVIFNWLGCPQRHGGPAAESVVPAWSNHWKKSQEEQLQYSRPAFLELLPATHLLATSGGWQWHSGALMVHKVRFYVTKDSNGFT